MLRRRRRDAQDAGDDRWVVAMGEYDGRPIVTRFDHGRRADARSGRFPFRIGVAVELTDPDERGFPGEDESARLAAVETEIETLVDGRALLVGVITTNGTREWVLYAAEHAWVEQFHRALDDTVSTYDVQVMAEHDPSWGVYAAFV